MSPEQLQRVFERFYRADASGHIPGTGLGMSIVKEIIEIMGGKVSVNSEPAMGTAVTILLPVVAVAEAKCKINQLGLDQTDRSVPIP
ncbi:sensor histidine kinase [Acidovorax temperans]|uniref:sensor histidine kinase n=1 Tax=Acidovorax temperans TaxID=80878 RepID=UPI002899F4F9|nr:sensor histidine kinase [Acidovorax temperans]